MEIEELTKRGVIWLYETNPRHQLFLQIKYPNDILYKGRWGDEILHFDRSPDPYMGQTGKIYCTYERYKQVAKYILDQMFQA